MLNIKLQKEAITSHISLFLKIAKGTAKDWDISKIKFDCDPSSSFVSAVTLTLISADSSGVKSVISENSIELANDDNKNEIYTGEMMNVLERIVDWLDDVIFDNQLENLIGSLSIDR